MADNKASDTVIERHKARYFRLKKHPFVVPVVTLLILVAITLFGIVAFNAYTIGPADSHVVHVFVDDEERTLPTRAKTVGELLKKLNVTVNEGDIVEPSVDTPVYQDDFSINVYRSREVVIRDRKRSIRVETASRSPRSIARNAGIVVYPEDEVLPDSTQDVLEGGFAEHYQIDRATPVTLIMYGQLLPIRTQAKTVDELLKEKQISTSSGDTITPAADSLLKSGSEVVITRPGQTIATKTESIPAPKEYVDDASLLQGVEEVREPGQPGKRIVTYDIQVEDGKVVSRNKIQSIVAVEPVPKIVARGTKVVITDPSDNVKIGEKLAAARGWTGSEFYCLYQLWQRESHWGTTAGNPTTGAYGIPQALPGSKMSSAGSDWRFNPATQITWGLGYVAGRYGTPCGAWNFFLANNYY